ncbi:hypothetical protein JCM10449v2_004066 [Rhodotorula kratochvilovae]
MANAHQVRKDHQQFANDNFSKSGASGLYDRARPSYPPAAHAQILSLLAPSSNSSVLELGAGTGLFTRGFVRAAQEQGEGRVGRVRAVEPSKGMREGFDRALKEEGLDKGEVEVDCVEGTFEKIPAEDGEADLVVIAQAFHWTGTSQLPAVRDIARVLKPGGAWVLIWNLEDRNVGWVAGLRDAYERFESDTPQYRLGLWKAMYDEQEYHERFTAPSHDVFRRSLPTTEDLAVQRVFSKSYITALSDEQRAELEVHLRATLRKGEGRKWIDEQEGVFEYPYETDLFIAKRK